MPSGRFFAAVGISVLVHAALLGALFYYPSGQFGRGSGSPGSLDTRVPSVEAIILLAEPPPERSPAALKPPPPIIFTKSTTSQPTIPSPPDRVPSPASQGPAHAVPSPGREPIAGPTSGAATFFQVRADGKAIVYVIDCSMSMGRSGAFDLARNELLASLERLPATARFQVIPYNRQAEPLSLAGRHELVPATAANKQRAADLIKALRAEGSTDHLKALRRALDLQADVVFFLTDADDLRADQVGLITQRNHGRAVIHAIELSDSPKRNRATTLPLLAQANRGDYRSVTHGQ